MSWDLVIRNADVVFPGVGPCPVDVATRPSREAATFTTTQGRPRWMALANGAVNTYNDVKEGVQTGLAEGREFIEGTGERIAEGVSGVADRVRDIDLPDIDMPDVDIDLPGPF